MNNNEITIRDIWTLWCCGSRIMRLISWYQHAPQVSEGDRSFELSWEDVDKSFENFCKNSSEARKNYDFSLIDQDNYRMIINFLKDFYSKLNGKYFNGFPENIFDDFEKSYSKITTQILKIEENERHPYIGLFARDIYFEDSNECSRAAISMVSQFGDKGFIKYKTNTIKLFKDIEDFTKAHHICIRGLLQ